MVLSLCFTLFHVTNHVTRSVWWPERIQLPGGGVGAVRVVRPAPCRSFPAPAVLIGKGLGAGQGGNRALHCAAEAVDMRHGRTSALRQALTVHPVVRPACHVRPGLPRLLTARGHPDRLHVTLNHRAPSPSPVPPRSATWAVDWLGAPTADRTRRGPRRRITWSRVTRLRITPGSAGMFMWRRVTFEP
jgi:hypothetical protein